jgi:RNA-binding protein 5/10
VQTRQKNLGDGNLREIASGKAAASQKATSSDTPKYRDRAQERRILHHQPDTPEDVGSSKRKADAPVAPPPPPPPPPVAPGKDESNVGNKLLQKMGWSQGMGLGTEGEGRVDPM